MDHMNISNTNYITTIEQTKQNRVYICELLGVTEVGVFPPIDRISTRKAVVMPVDIYHRAIINGLCGVVPAKRPPSVH